MENFKKDFVVREREREKSMTNLVVNVPKILFQIGKVFFFSNFKLTLLFGEWNDVTCLL